MELVALVPLLIVVAFWAAAFFFAFFAFRRWMQAPTGEGEEQAEHTNIPDTVHTGAH